MLRGMRPFRWTIVLLLLAWHIGPAAAAERCTPAREGAVACLGGKLCACRHDPGGALTGRPPGTRWDCGALRPSCGMAPAELGAPSERVPPPFLPPPYLPPPPVPPPTDWR